MAYNICRPIVLYNDFLPPDDKPHDKWQYIAFGYFDGLKVGKNIFQNGQCSLEELWNYDVSQMKELDGRYSAQIIYGFRSEEGSGVCDSQFWEEALREGTEYPFMFVILIQGEIGSGDAKIISRKEWEAGLSVEGKRKAISYLTLDNSSMILVLLCREYEDGTGVIDGFHRKEDASLLIENGIKLSYSYTVAAVQKKFLNSVEIDRMKDKRVERVYIYAIERHPGSMEYVWLEINKKCGKPIRKESVLGCNDEVIIIEDMPWNEFLMLFQDIGGKLNHSCPDYGNSFTGLTTIIARRQDEGETLVNLLERKEVISERKASLQEACRKMGEKLRTLICEISKRHQGLSYETLERYLYQITNALQKFENTPVPDYIYCSMYLPIHLVLKIAGEVQNFNNSYFYNAFYEFVKSLNLCTQNAIRSDRQFTQSLDLDIRIYNAPVCLRAFYNAFIYNMKNFLGKIGEQNASGRKYEFLTCLGVTSTVQVRELFKNMSNDKRLFLVSVPEKQIYDMKLMLIMLSHEVGHFVGQAVRNRKYRYNCAIQIMANIISSYFRTNIEEEYQDIQNEDYWREFTKKIERYIREQMENLEDSEYLKQCKFSVNHENLEDFCKKHQRYRYYTEWLGETLLDSVSEVLVNKREELFGYLREMEYLHWLEKDVSQAVGRQREFVEKTASMTQKINGYFLWDERCFSAESAVDMMMRFFKECEADLVSILTLELSLEDYLYAIWKNASDQGKQKWEMPAETIIRSSLVLLCMKSTGVNSDCYCWTDEEVKKLYECANSHICNMLCDIQNFLSKYLPNNGGQIRASSVFTTMDVFLNSEVLMCLAEYLLECRDSFQKELGSESEEAFQLKREKRQLLDIYRINKENAEELVWSIQEYIERYQRCLQKEIEKCGEEKNGYGVCI